MIIQGDWFCEISALSLLLLRWFNGVKSNETLRTSTASINEAGGKSRHEVKFTKVCDERKRAVRGPWKRKERFYAQLTVFDPQSPARLG
jgi:hypothetical protein